MDPMFEMINVVEYFKALRYKVSLTIKSPLLNDL